MTDTHTNTHTHTHTHTHMVECSKVAVSKPLLYKLFQALKYKNTTQ